MRSIRGSLEHLQPLIDVSIAAPGAVGRTTVRGLLDTGATRTCLSHRLIQSLELPPRSRILVASATSYPARVPSFSYSLGLFCGDNAGGTTLFVFDHDFVGPGFQGTDAIDVLIGMDLLGTGRLLFERGDFRFDFSPG